MAPSYFSEILLALLDRAERDLAAADRPVGRAHLVPGLNEAWDDCCEGGGQLYVRVISVSPSGRPFPAVDVSTDCPTVYAALIGVGVLRCASTVDDRGKAPAPAVLTAEALAMLDDMGILRRTLTELTEDAWETAPPRKLTMVRPTTWTPKGPEGGCSGGEWQAYLGVSPCFLPRPDVTP